MNKTTVSRFNISGFVIGLGTGVALSASLGLALGIPLGVGLAVVFGLTRARKC
jgi:hypothetical protein